MKKRVAMLVACPAPRDIFKSLTDSFGYKVQVFYCRERQMDQQWHIGPLGYSAQYLKNYAGSGWYARRMVSDINPSIWGQLSAFQPDAVVIHGYASITCLLAILWSWFHRVPFLVRGDSNGLDEVSKSLLIRLVKKTYLGWVVKRAAGLVSIGTLNTEFWKRYGAPSEKIFLAPYPVDNAYYQTNAKHFYASRERTRLENGWKHHFLLLYVGRLVPCKRVDLLIEAVRKLSSRRSDIGLLILGDGCERDSLENQAKDLSQVFFLGFQDRPELPKYYAAADLFVLPSDYEPWGTVVNEAMASGLPVIATRSVGAARDLIAEGENGYVVPGNDVSALASTIDTACQFEERLRMMGKKAENIVQNWGYDSALVGFHEALSHCLG